MVTVTTAIWIASVGTAFWKPAAALLTSWLFWVR